MTALHWHWRPSVDEKNVVSVPPDSLDWTTSVLAGGQRKKIVPSGDQLPEDGSTSDATTISEAGSDIGGAGGRKTAAGTTRRRRRRRTGEGEVGGSGRVWTADCDDNSSLKTPDSLLTSELLDDSVFDGELDWIGA